MCGSTIYTYARGKEMRAREKATADAIPMTVQDIVPEEGGVDDAATLYEHGSQQPEDKKKAME